MTDRRHDRLLPHRRQVFYGISIACIAERVCWNRSMQSSKQASVKIHAGIRMRRLSYATDFRIIAVPRCYALSYA